MGDFKRLIERAKRGNRDAMEQLLSIYAHLINRMSVVDDHIDVDLELDELDITSAETKATYREI